MAEQGWTAQVAAAATVAAGAGAAQLGIGYGLGIVVWPTTPTTGDSVWLAGLGWALWIAAGSTVLGAVAATRLGTSAGIKSQVSSGALGRLVLAAAAAVGALLPVVLIALPARAAVRADTFSPQSIAAGYAGLGVLLGIVVAWWAATSRPVASNVLATAGWLWTLAVVAIITGLHSDLPATGAQLGNWRMTGLGERFWYGTVHWPTAVVTLGAALLIGILAAWPATRRGEHSVAAAASGAIGPLLVAFGYFALAPQLTGARGMLQSAFLIAPYTVLAGLAGSALVVTLSQKAANRRAVRRPAEPRPATRSAADPSGATSPGSDVADRPAVRPAAATGRARLPKARSASASTTPSSPSARSTVKAPPALPTVAQINPPPKNVAGAGTATGTPSASAAASKIPPAARASDSASGDEATAPSARTSAAKAGSPAKGTGRTSTAKATPARKSARPGKPAPTAPAFSEAAPGTAATASDTPTEADTPTAADAQPADSAMGSGSAGSKATSGGETPSAVTAALTDSAPLWVDDSEPSSGADREGAKDRWRPFGRRPNSAAKADKSPDSPD